jgi:hypothetical protein
MTADTQGLSAGGNVLEYESGFGLPWIVDMIKSTENYPCGRIVVSYDESRIYCIDGLEIYPSRWRLNRVNTSSGSLANMIISSDQMTPLIGYDPVNDVVLTAAPYDGTHTCLTLRNPSSLDAISQADLPFMAVGMLALASGGRVLLCDGYTNLTRVIDTSNFEQIDSLSYRFDYGETIEGYRTYVLGSGPLRRIDQQTGAIVANSGISLQSPEAVPLTVSSNGELCLYSEGTVYMLDPATLTTIDQAVLPVSSYSCGIVIEARDSLYAYARIGTKDDVQVYNVETGAYVGDVLNNYETHMEFPSSLVYLKSTKEIWCMYLDIMGSYGLYRINY